MAISIADGSCNPTRPLGLLSGPEKTCPRPKQSMWHRLGFRRWLGRDDRDAQSPSGDSSPNNNNTTTKPHDNLTRRLSRRVGVGLPRAATFRRQDSERRDRLTPFQPEARAVSADRRRTLSAQRRRSPPPDVGHRLSAPEIPWRDNSLDTMVEESPVTNHESEFDSEWDRCPDTTDAPTGVPDGASEDVIETELEKRWILNLSMHFRDRSQREKFFVTYAETPNRWRRVTVSCDYRNAPPDSLEHDLKELRYQRDKCARIYESLRESLPEIQFYDTVTNLKLETRDGRLHVHVTEDVNEIIPYPPISCAGHLYNARLIPEHKLHFDGHLSGFVYNVQLDGRVFIKKEIPGPETVDEFLYEINALHALNGSQCVIQVEGIVVDDRQELVKGLLISYAEQGALVDILYDQQGEIPWPQRERWAKQVVHGLCEIHEAGYVQGDFTLSNIVVDSNGDAKIIDINRRGCPVGWEPPEIAAKIESNQRISMYIGVKTDLFQLGMTLWALAMQDDEPERQDRPLVLDEDVDVPEYYRKLIAICLSPVPRHRLSAKELLAFFPRDIPTGHYLPPINPLENTHKEALPPRTVPYELASLSNLTGFEGSADNLDRGRLGRSSLDDEYSLSQCDSRSAFVSLHAEKDSRTTLVDGETKARGSELAENSEVDGLPSLRNHNEHPYACNSDERGVDGCEEPALHTGDPALPSNLEEQERTGDEHMALEEKDDEKDIGLGADSDPSGQDIAGDEKAFVPPLRKHNLPKDLLIGVGDHTACPLRDAFSRQQSPEPAQNHEPSWALPTTPPTHLDQTPMAEMGNTHTPDAEAAHAHWPKEASPHSISSLLNSALPINPRLNMSNTGTPTYANRFPSKQATDPARQTAHLSDSILPINPAFTDHLPLPE